MTTVGHEFLPLPPGVDGDALMGAWLDAAVDAGAERDADVEAREVGRRLDRVQRDARRKRAYEMHVAGAQYRHVADELGVDVHTAWNDVQAYAKVAVPVSERELARKLSIERHEGVLLRLMVDIRGTVGEDRLRVIDRFLKVQKRIDELCGVDDRPADEAPEPEELDSVQAVDQQVEEYIERLAEMGMLSGPPPGHPG